MIMKKTLSLLLAVIMIAMTFTVFPITANAVDVDAAATAEATVYNVGTSAELISACKAINNTGAGEYIINLTADIEDGYIEIKTQNAVVTVLGNGKYISNARTAVRVSDGATVNLGDGQSELTLLSDNISHAVGNDDPGLVYVLENSICTMNDNVTLKDHKGNNYLGGGVTVQGGTFHMYGGTIKNCGIEGGSVCYGGGVAVFAGGSFIMDDGLITECYIKSNCAYNWNDYYNSEYKIDPRYTSTACGGGVFVTGGSSFTMNNGTISNNTVVNNASESEKLYGDLAYGGGIGMMITLNERNDPDTLGTMGNPQSSVVVNGGTITGNQAENGGGIYASGYYYCYSVPIGTKAPAEQVTANPGLYINGGEISENTATDAGGGIFVTMLCPWNRANNELWQGSKTQIHNATIKNNSADNGAGVESYGYWTQMDIDGCTITGNEAASIGGGIALLGNTSSGLTKLKDSSVTNNTSGDIGAGVFYDSQSKLYISGKDIIQNNTYDGKLNNLNVLDKDYPVYVNGALTGSQIGLSDPTLWDDGKEDYDAEAVSTEYLTSGYKANNPEVHPSEYFTSDHETWIVDSTKVEEKEIEDKSICYYEYTATRYPVTSGENPAGIQNDYVRLDVPKTGTGAIKSLQEIFNSLVDRYKNKGYTVNYNLEKFKRYTTPDGTQITIQLQNDYTTLAFSKNGKSVTYRGEPSFQRTADDGDLYLKISYASNIDNYSFSVNPDENPVTIKYYTTTPINDYICEYDDLGNVTAKLVLNGGKDGYTIKYGKKTETVGVDGEVHLIRTKPNYHINNDVIDDQYGNNDIFTSYVEAAIKKEVKVGETIGRFYTIPEVVTTKQDSCPYIFKGWYYDKENDNDSHPVQFDTDKYAKDIYAHWIKVEDVEKDENDKNIVPYQSGMYGGFDLAGVQIRKEMFDRNFDKITPGGMRFITTLSKNVVNQINTIQPNNIEYGYVAATHKDWIDYHKKALNGDEKLQYVSTTANGIDTSSANATDENYFGFAKNVNCTSKQTNKNGVVRLDHKNYGEYLIYSLVITYEEEGSDKGKNVLARPYIKYTDANGSERVAYSDYRGISNTIGGCYTSYKYVAEEMAPSGN